MNKPKNFYAKEELSNLVLEYEKILDKATSKII